MERINQNQPTQAPEGIDLDKLSMTVRKHWLWIVFIFAASNLAAYLTIRWTKDVFESYSELKLDVKQDATGLGIKNIVEDQNLNIISGEIEQIKSKLFFNRVIDSMDIWVGYYTIGRLLQEERYKTSPFHVIYDHHQTQFLDSPIYFNFLDKDHYSVRLKDDGASIKGKFGEPINLNGLYLTIKKSNDKQPPDDEDYLFILHSRASLLDYLTSNIHVDPLNYNANTIRISFQDLNGHKAFDIVNEIDSLYLNYSYQQKNLTNSQKIDWLNKELGQIEKKMEGFENYFENFTLQNKSSNVEDELKRTISQINQLDSQRFEYSKRLNDLNGLTDALASRNFALSYTTQQFLPDYLNRNLETLQRMSQEQSRLGLSYNENTFAFKQKDNELSTMRNTVFSELSQLKKEWMKRLADLNSRKEKLEVKFASMPDKNTQFTKQQRYYKLHEELYLTMMQSKAQFEITQAGTTPDFKILSPATFPTIPISPKRYMILAAGFVAGFVLNFFLIALLYLTNNKITSIQEIERAIQVPVLGSVPTSNHRLGPIHVIDNPKSMVSEAIRTLRTNLDFFAVGGAKVIAISSTISGEGKSFLALNLGGILAQSNKRVILLNLDMRKQKAILPVKVDDPSKGISTILIRKNEWRDCIIKTVIDHFDYLPAGPHPPNPSELLLNHEFTTLLEELKKEYDYIVLDTPPAGLVTDGIMAMKHADLSIYVFRANYSRRDYISVLKRIITINKLTNLSVVLNALPASSKAYGYGYYEDRTHKKSRIKNILKG